MHVRKIKIGPEDEARLRELLKIHEDAIDRLTDEELDAAEQQTSEHLQRLLQESGKISQKPSAKTFHFPLKTGAIAFLAAAAAMLFVQMHVSENAPFEPQMVTKGLVQAPAISCDSSIVESDGTTPDDSSGRYAVNAGKSSYLKLHCGRPVYVHLGFMKGDVLHLEWENLSVSPGEKVVMKGLDRVDITALFRTQKDWIVVVTEKPVKTGDLSSKDRAGLWMEEIPLELKR